LPRRPLLLIAMALITLVGIGADLKWRTYTNPGLAASAENSSSARESAGLAVAQAGTQADQELAYQANLPDRLSVRRMDSWERSVLASRGEIQRAEPATSSAVKLFVNGLEVAAVVDEAAALSVKEQILEEYRTDVLGNVKRIDHLDFRETLEWQQGLVPASALKTVEEAISILKYGTDKVVTYVVKPGDTSWDIAINYQVTTDKLADANPGANLDLLSIGQKLKVSFNDPYVHTVSVSQRVAREGIPFTEQVEKDSDLWPWQYQVVSPGAWGTRELLLREHRENGKLVRTEVLENIVLQQPKVQTAKIGTKQIPALGTGSLVYPVVGQTTSLFGPRWGGVHHGIDIAAPTGIPILAADSGMVVFRGWSGNYGNLIQIDHGEGKMVTWYAHLHRFNVSLGDTVNKGDVIGYVGSTGYSTGPHLHYEVHVNGRPVNPLNFYQ
jgi:murein DD-endopeptidase MepM/ murein hydrolase activator NlpD